MGPFAVGDSSSRNSEMLPRPPSVAMRLLDQGKLELDAPVHHYLPRFSGGLKNDVTVRMLLDHTSGLKSYVPFYVRARGSRARTVDLLYAQPLVRPPEIAPSTVTSMRSCLA